MKKCKTKKILVIDDEGELLDMLTLRLEAEGFQVAVALEGETGIDQAETFKPDVIILDLVMPKMNGWEVGEKLKNNPVTKNIPIILLTAASHADLEDQARQAGMKHFIQKPFEPEELLSVLRMECS